MEALERVIGYRFRRHNLLREAATHSSLRYEGVTGMADNQRLEFLGDAVLQLLLSELLFHRFTRSDEGGLTKTRASLVSEKSLAAVAQFHRLGEHLILGKGEEASGGRYRDSTLADMVEAILGAVFLDAGLDTARSVLLHLMREPLAELKQVVTDAQGNPKGQLQELIQARTTERAVYSIIAETGEDHSKQFHASVSWRNQVYGHGIGKTKKDAETEAARATLNNALFQDALAALPLSPPSYQQPRRKI
jgi:ribonuclease-3